MKSILFITAFPPNQKTAGQDYTRRLILDLLKKNYKVSLIYANYPVHQVELPEDVEILNMINPKFQNCFHKLNFHPFFTKRFEKSTLTLIQNLSSKFDIVYFDFSQVQLFSLYIKHPYKVLMCHDVIFQKYKRSNIIQLLWVYLSEKKILNTANKIVTFSEKDSSIIKKIYNLNALHVNFYLKSSNIYYTNEKINKNTFCFYGAWNRKENADALKWFFNKVYLLLQNKFKFIIIGGGLEKSLQKKLSGYIGVNYVGFVEDPIFEISKCQALIAPLHSGAGVKVKVIDALTSGTSVIGTDVAFEGIKDNSENKLFYKNISPKDFVFTLDHWNVQTTKAKQLAANEFYRRYNKNHFPDYLATL